MRNKPITLNQQALHLAWPGKEQMIANARRKSHARLTHIPKLSAGNDSDNLLIEGDNLEALRLLQSKFQNTIRLIYIDPPYNTGNAFVFHDAFEHAGWLNMMYPRLLLARELLTADGAIFISIDDNEIDKLRLIMSEIFGEANFVAQITVQSNPRGRQAERHFARVHEYLLVYARDAVQCRLSGAELTEEQAEEFDQEDDCGRRYRLLGLRQRGAHSLKEDRPAMYYPIFVDPTCGGISLAPTRRHSVKVLPKKSTGQAGRWMWGLKRAQENVELLEAHLIRGRNEWDIFVRDFLDDPSGNVRQRKLKTIWDDKTLNYQNGKRELKELLGKAIVEYPKPTALIHKLINMIDEPDATFLDFFAGSGTLGHAVLEANAKDNGTRKFILIQINEPTEDPQFPTIADVCRTRMQKVVAKLKSPRAPNCGFSYFKLLPGSKSSN